MRIGVDVVYLWWCTEYFSLLYDVGNFKNVFLTSCSTECDLNLKA